MKFLSIALFFLATSCGKSSHPTEILVKDGESCYHSVADNGVWVHCPNQEPALLPYLTENECKFTVEGSNLVYTCPGSAPVYVSGSSSPTGASNPTVPTPQTGGNDNSPDGGNVGPRGPRGPQGANGTNGTNGTNGLNGRDGTSCTLEVDPANCLWITCSDGKREKLRGPL